MIAERTPTRHYRSLFWPVVLITAGLVWVLHNVGLIDGGGLVLSLLGIAYVIYGVLVMVWFLAVGWALLRLARGR